MRSFADVWRRSILVTFLALANAGCLPLPPPPRLTPYPPFTCESFTESYWQEFRFGADSSYEVDDVIVKIVELWELDRSQLRIVEDGKNVVVRWLVEFSDEADPAYAAHYHKDRRFSSVFFHWRSRKPTITQVIGCLGDPEFYAAYYYQGVEVRALKVDLWYVEKGFVLRGATFHGQEPSPQEISPDFPMALFTATRSGDLERMIELMYGSEVLALLLCPIRPWAGSIEELEVESYIQNPRCNV